MSNLSDLDNVTIKEYQTADDLMKVYLKSRSGFLKISLDKSQSSREAYRKLKETGEGIKTILAK